MKRHRLRRVDGKKENAKILAASPKLEKDYMAYLRKRVRRTHAYTMGSIEGGGSVAQVRAAERAWEKNNPPSKVWLGGFAKRIDTSAVRSVNLVVSRIGRISVASLPSGAPATALNAAFVKENVSLIKSIDSRYFDDIAKMVQESVAKGQSKDELARQMQQRFNVSKSRADLIARDQTAKHNGNITQSRQADLGITKYEWSTSEDERVREEHADRNGDIFEWAKPPPDGHPGEPIQCRCVALPVIDL